MSPKVDFSASWLILSIVLPFGGSGFFLTGDGCGGGAFSSSVEYKALWLNTILLSSFENSSTLKSRLSPTSAFEPSSLARFLAEQNPSIPYGNSRIAPLSFLLMMVHL